MGTLQIVQAKSAHCTLKPNDRVHYIKVQGKVWSQPIDYSLPQDLTST